MKDSCLTAHIYGHVAMYLRKSRRDLELEAVGAEDTLERHRRVLLELARQYGLTVVRIYQEVVSGDTIEGRPQMRELLRDVADGAYDAVLCHDIDRLGRGGMRDQGEILETFKWSHTAIITPDRIYNLDEDMDEESVEFKALSSRYEYRMIKKRLARGREASVREGKFIGNKAPYGYERYKLQGQKGWSLRPLEPQAQVVRDVFRWYTAPAGERLGVALIARRLNERGLPAPGGKDWTNNAIRSMLSNPVYAGDIRAHSRPAQKHREGSQILESRPRNRTPEIYPGLHEALVPREQFDAAQALLTNNKSRPGPKQVPMKNPLSGLVICDQCGRAMIRRPYGGDRPDSLICSYTSCPCVGSTLETVEAAVLDGLRQWLTDLSLRYEPPAGEGSAEELAALRKSMDAAQAEAARIVQQKDAAYNLVERGVYTPDVFSRRMAALEREAAAVGAQLVALREEAAQIEAAAQARSDLLPAVRHVLDAYELAATPEEKNQLLRTVLEKISYHKTRRERWTGGSDLSLTLYPRLR